MKTFTKLAVKASLASIISALLLVGCTKNTKTEYGLDVKETLRINIQTEPPSLDWQKATDTTSSKIDDNIMEGLVTFDLNDPELSLRPALATEWQSEDKAKRWIFTIRKGVKWTDGVELTAQHFVDGFERLLNPKTAAQYAYFLYGIKNAKQYAEGKIKDFKEVGAKVNDKGQLVVELEQSQSYFPQLLTHHCTYPARIDVIAKHGDRWTEPGNIVTLGAYKLKIWDHDKAIVLERNEDYYGEKAKTKYVLAYMIIETSTAINLIDSGKLDVQPEQLPSKELSRLRSRKDYHERSILALYYYGMNTKKPPMDNVLVRKAISHAIDRKEITTLINGGQLPMTGWVPPGMFGYEPERGLRFDASKAKEFLDKAGYKDRSKFPKLQITVNTNEDHQRIAENIQAQLKRNLGITVEINNEEWKIFLNRLRTDPPHLFRFGWVGDFPDPDNFLNLMTSYSENNRTRWGNKKYDDLIQQAVSVTDKEERRKLYSEAQRILTEEDVPVVPIYSYVNQALISPRVKNFPANVMNRFPFKGVELQ